MDAVLSHDACSHAAGAPQHETVHQAAVGAATTSPAPCSAASSAAGPSRDTAAAAAEGAPSSSSAAGPSSDAAEGAAAEGAGASDAEFAARLLKAVLGAAASVPGVLQSPAALQLASMGGDPDLCIELMLEYALARREQIELENEKLAEHNAILCDWMRYEGVELPEGMAEVYGDEAFPTRAELRRGAGAGDERAAEAAAGDEDAAEPDAEAAPEPEAQAEAAPQPEPGAEAAPEPEPEAEAAPELEARTKAPVADADAEAEAEHTQAAATTSTECGGTDVAGGGDREAQSVGSQSPQQPESPQLSPPHLHSGHASGSQDAGGAGAEAGPKEAVAALPADPEAETPPTHPAAEP